MPVGKANMQQSHRKTLTLFLFENTVSLTTKRCRWEQGMSSPSHPVALARLHLPAVHLPCLSAAAESIPAAQTPPQSHALPQAT